MDVPVGAEVRCRDGACGQSTYVLVNPVRQQITHLVVREHDPPHPERVVPVDEVIDATPETITLACSIARLKEMEPFVETEYIRENMPALVYRPPRSLGLGSYMVWPYAVPDEPGLVPVETRAVPPGELAVKRGAMVRARDGRIGRVDEFLVDPANEHITHLVMHERPLLGQKALCIPVSGIDRIKDNTVYLALSKDEVEALPAIPSHR